MGTTLQPVLDLSKISTTELLRIAQERARAEGITVKTGRSVAPSFSVEKKKYGPKSGKTGEYVGVFVRQAGEFRDLFIGKSACAALLTMFELTPKKFKEGLRRGASGEAGFTFVADKKE